MVSNIERNISVWPKLKINFWGITKTGHTSLKNHLYMLENKTHANLNLKIHGKRNTKYITADEAEKNRNQNITLVRNPIERFRSGYSDFFNKRRDKGKKIEDQLKQKINNIDDLLSAYENLYDLDMDPHFRPQTWYLDGFKGIIQKLETISEKWLLPIPSMILKQNVSHSNKIPLTEQQINRIKHIYKKDFNLLDY